MDQEVLEGVIPLRETIPDLVGESYPASENRHDGQCPQKVSHQRDPTGTGPREEKP